VDLLESGCGLLFVHHRVSVRIYGSEPPRYSKELERAERIGQRVAVPLGAPQKCCAGLAPVTSRP
jgi:hypothetical protein